MRYGRTILLVISTLTFAMAVQSHAQVSLYPQVSAETNAMGGAGVSFVSDNALATIANPAELGLFSLHGILSASYMPEISRKLNASAINVGLNLGEFLHSSPVKMSLGVGYSNPRYSYPVFFGENLTNSVETDVANTLTIGMGLDYLVRLGLGYNLKWVTTKGGPPYYNSAYGPDLGAILELPIISLISKLNSPSTVSVYGVSPLFNLTIGYSERNTGDLILPREGDLGWNFEAGLETEVDGCRWKWLSFTWIRQVDDPLRMLNSGTYVAKSGLGNFQIYDNLIAGDPTGNLSVEKGWQIQLGQFIYIRGGSATGPEIPTYATFGWGVKLDGFIKALVFAHGMDANGTFGRFLLDHLDFQFAYSKADGEIVGYGNTTGIGFKGEPFESLNLSVK